jgi:hypothetical protein
MAYAPWECEPIAGILVVIAFFGALGVLAGIVTLIDKFKGK